VRVVRGGATEDGTYVLVSSTFYGSGSLPEADRITWLVCGTAWATAQEASVSAPAVRVDTLARQ